MYKRQHQNTTYYIRKYWLKGIGKTPGRQSDFDIATMRQLAMIKYVLTDTIAPKLIWSIIKTKQ
ncbi:hypothetical protein CG709_11625 [Lachnotalea glycerini]|nr:hypothetical protein CG709_11625 [Lachnotalea glycerini]